MVLRTVTHGTTYYEHYRDDVHWSRTHPQQFDTIVESDPCAGFSQPYSKQVARQHTLLQVAQAHQHQSDSHLLVEYDPRIMEYPIHSYALFTPPVGRGIKLLPKHRGPFQVMDKTDSIYIIEDLVSGKRITTYNHNLRPFIYDPIRNDPWTPRQP